MQGGDLPSIPSFSSLSDSTASAASESGKESGFHPDAAAGRSLFPVSLSFPARTPPANAGWRVQAAARAREQVLRASRRAACAALLHWSKHGNAAVLNAHIRVNQGGVQGATWKCCSFGCLTVAVCGTYQHEKNTAASVSGSHQPHPSYCSTGMGDAEELLKATP